MEPSALGLGVTALTVAVTVGLDHMGMLMLTLTPALIVATLAGILLATWGWAMLRQLAFPLVFLLFLLPLPPRVMAAIDYPLQTVCTRATAGIAHAAGLGVTSAGAQLQFPDPNLGIIVAPGCNGLRSSVSLLLIAAVYAYLLRGSKLRRTALVAAAIPLAYVGNFVRLLGAVEIIGRAGEAALKYMTWVDNCLGLLAFALSLALLFFLARTLRCGEFQHIG